MISDKQLAIEFISKNYECVVCTIYGNKLYEGTIWIGHTLKNTYIRYIWHVNDLTFA